MLRGRLKPPLVATLGILFLYLNSIFALSDSSVYTSGTTPKGKSLIFNPLTHWTVLCLTCLCFSFLSWNFICISKELHCQQNKNCLLMFPILQQTETCLQHARVPGVNFSDTLLKIYRDDSFSLSPHPPSPPPKKDYSTALLSLSCMKGQRMTFS